MEVAIGLMGLGTVGSGVYQLMLERGPEIEAATGLMPRITKILVNDPRKSRQVAVDRRLLTKNPVQILGDPAIQIVVEVMGGEEPAHAYVKDAIRRGKHVVLANKELLAKHGRTLQAQARDKAVDLLFEASVAGGIPIIRALRESLASDQVHKILGILNGTTNYILTRMDRDRMTFAAALKEAQAAGYAEADPSKDLDGTDAAFKLSILASIAFGSRVPVSQVPHEGIRRIAQQDIEYARELGYVVKLLAYARNADGAIEAQVAPGLLPLTHPLAAVWDNFNAILVESQWTGPLMFYGAGAGQRPTAAAVVSDVMQVLRHLPTKSNGWAPANDDAYRPVAPAGDRVTRYYLRLRVADEPGALAQIAKVFATERISFASVLQKERGDAVVDVVFMTHETPHARMAKALEKVGKLSAVDQVATAIRVQE